MTSRIAASVSRAVRRMIPTTVNHHVHFHVDSAGRPFVCDYSRCDSPSLTQDEAMLVQR
jgi:hypothetical protein